MVLFDHVGDTLLLYTDGLTDARTGATSERYGDEGLRSFARRLAPTTAGAAVTAIAALLDELSDGLDDDTAVLALSVPSPAYWAGPPRLAESKSPLPSAAPLPGWG